MWQRGDLREIAHAHEVRIVTKDTKYSLLQKLGEHVCTPKCPVLLLIFTTLRALRTEDQVRKATTAVSSIHSPSDDYAFFQLADDALRRAMIAEWQETFTTKNFARVVCSVCARSTSQKDCQWIHPSQVDLRLLRNDALPIKVRPTSYDFQLYDRALLDPTGLRDPWAISEMQMCTTCHKELCQRNRMPKLSLANWLYYGRDALPQEVKAALKESTQFDRLLVARARGTRISFRFSELQKFDPADPNPPPREDPTVSQRCIKGNVLIMPQNTTRLNVLIPPNPDSIRDTVCAVFVGRTRPTPQTIGRLGPVLVRKSRVKTIATFLCRDNPHYAPDQEFHGFSQHNLDVLFGTDAESQDEGVPCSMDIGFLEAEEAIDAPNADPANPFINEPEPQVTEDILMENVGYTSGDDSPVAYRDMKLQAISHCLNNGRFIRSQAGDRFVPDFENPSLLTWMFPHLDPWGIGGFHHPGRAIPLTMQEQLTYLLQVHHSPDELQTWKAGSRL
ncbi:hypothetical protein C8Q76DRAFT_819012 [Earliella scabrosa]|nr:hypothetical protein C8Q76DRAFT_819012 [Earliella scabrosa]